MNMKRFGMSNVFLVVVFAILVVAIYRAGTFSSSLHSQTDAGEAPLLETLQSVFSHPLAIETMRTTEYPGSDLVIKQTLSQGSNYSRYIASYTSEGNKIYGLLTIPRGNKPERGWPVIVFNHGYIPPTQYRTTEKYSAYQDGFARNGYITFKSDYRGHGESEGDATGGYGSSGYTTDVLNAVASLRRHPDVDDERIGMWGHSMGGYITLRSMVAQQNIKAAVIWAGVVGSYPDLISSWRRTSPSPSASPTGQRRWRQMLLDTYGTPENNPDFWNSISATSYLSDISGPLQIHHGTADSSVPVLFSEQLQERMKETGGESELYVYQGDDHNLSKNFSIAMNRSIAFFDTHLKE